MRTRLTDNNILSIWDDLKVMSRKEVAKRYGVSTVTISSIARKDYLRYQEVINNYEINKGITDGSITIKFEEPKSIKQKSLFEHNSNIVSRLSEDDIINIWNDLSVLSRKDIAEKYNISTATVSNIANKTLNRYRKIIDKYEQNNNTTSEITVEVDDSDLTDILREKQRLINKEIKSIKESLSRIEDAQKIINQIVKGE